MALISGHRSVRRFRPWPVPEDHIAAAAGAARMASTSSWMQAYSLLQVTDSGERERLAALTGGQSQVAEAGAFFVILADARRHRLIAEDAGQPLASNLESFLLTAVDASLFAQNLALSFESQGYGVCYIGGLRNDLPAVDRLLELPADVYPLFGLCVGIPDETPEQRPRLPLDSIWFKDRYPTDEVLREGIARHDREAADHYSNRGQSGRDWSGGIWRRCRAPMREGLRDYYESKGASFD